MNRIINIALAAIMLLAASASSAIERVTVTPNNVKTRLDSRPSLLEKFRHGEKLTPEQMMVVYYGQAFVPEKAAASYPEVDDAYAKKDYALTLKLVDEVLKTNPVALNQLFRAFVSAKQSDNPSVKARADVFESQIDNICTVIFASGTGVATESPFITLSKEDALAFLRNYIQPKQIIGQASVGNMDAVKVMMDGRPDESIFYFSRP